VRLAPDVDLTVVAQMTRGRVGADLANIINESALLAERRGHDAVLLSDIQEAVERIVAGLEKKNRVLNRMERERVAHHEVGHALVALSLPGADPIVKISIIPRGIAALGYTLQRPTEDRFLMTRTELENKIATLLGGRVAEELMFSEPSTGAQDDLRKATDIARSMVRAYGMSDKLGLTSFEPAHHPLWIDGGEAARGDHGEAIQSRIDEEVADILEAQHQRVSSILGPRLDVIRAAAEALIAKESLTGEELRALVAREAGGAEAKATA
jgi:cell division protease FtsH